MTSKKQLACDRVKTMAGGFLQRGLLEMARKRICQSLSHMLCKPAKPASAARASFA
ncbi:hypothetical protein [Acidovorax sp.]|uniref:hypothetical protein n=1 Tax=Acidovorax sp. TaxID=1872122 RepID=UPI00391F0637